MLSPRVCAMSHKTRRRVVTSRLSDVPLLFSNQNQTKEIEQIRGGGGLIMVFFFTFNLFCSHIVENFSVLRLYIIRVRF